MFEQSDLVDNAAASTGESKAQIAVKDNIHSIVDRHGLVVAIVDTRTFLFVPHPKHWPAGLPATWSSLDYIHWDELVSLLVEAGAIVQYVYHRDQWGLVVILPDEPFYHEMFANA